MSALPVSDNSTPAPENTPGGADVRTFGVEDYDEYWQKKGMRKAPRAAQARMANIVSSLVPKPGPVLELGPGPGHLFRLIAEAGYTTYAIDASKMAIDGLNVPAERTRVANLNAEWPDFGVRFKAIAASMVLHHIDKPFEFLGQLHASMDSGAHLVLSIPNIITLKNRLDFLVGRFPQLSLSHRNFMIPTEVYALLESAKFKVVLVKAARNKFLNNLIPTLFSNELIVVAQRV